MNFVLNIFSILVALFPIAVGAQTLAPAEPCDNEDTYSHRNVPHSLECMVASSTLIVKGRFGEYLGNRPYYGSEGGKDIEEDAYMERRGVSREEARTFYALPLSEYEIIIDEVFLGDVDYDTIIYSRMENAPVDRQLTNPEVDRLFFLILNPDNETYFIMGESSILSDIDGHYRYDYIIGRDPARDAWVIEKMSLNSVPDMRVEEFERVLKADIERVTRQQPLAPH